MLHRVLVALDSPKVGMGALDLAVCIAKQFNIRLTGLGVLDIPWITAAQPEPLGGGAYKLHRDDEVILQSRLQIAQSLASFKNRCETENIDHDIKEVEGFPATEIEILAQEHDLIIMGKTTDFHYEFDDQTGLTVQHISRYNPRPLLITPEKVPAGNKVLIAYDGSLQSARALHMFLLLGLGQGKDIHIVSVSRSQNEADSTCVYAKRMCESHNIPAVATGVRSSSAPEKIIKKKIQDLKPSMLVMGAFGDSGFREFLFGTTTENLVKETNVPLFIHH